MKPRVKKGLETGQGGHDTAFVGFLLPPDAKRSLVEAAELHDCTVSALLRDVADNAKIIVELLQWKQDPSTRNRVASVGQHDAVPA